MALHPLRLHHRTDPRQDIIDDMKEFIDHLKPVAALIALVMYERGKQKDNDMAKSESGLLWIPDVKGGVIQEDKFQGKVGLVIAMGPLAFTEDDTHKWGNAVPKIHDWVMVSVGDTFSFDLPGPRRVRMVEDVNVKMIVSHEIIDAVW